jgi:hypothetical protein
MAKIKIAPTTARAKGSLILGYLTSQTIRKDRRKAVIAMTVKDASTLTREVTTSALTRVGTPRKSFKLRTLNLASLRIEKARKSEAKGKRFASYFTIKVAGKRPKEIESARESSSLPKGLFSVFFAIKPSKPSAKVDK